MKLKYLITFGLTSYASYQLVKNRQQLKADYLESKKAIQAAKSDLDNIKKNLTIIKQERANLDNLSQDLKYKLRVFSQESQAHLTEINGRLAKYQHEH